MYTRTGWIVLGVVGLATSAAAFGGVDSGLFNGPRKGGPYVAKASYARAIAASSARRTNTGIIARR